MMTPRIVRVVGVKTPPKVPNLKSSGEEAFFAFSTGISQPFEKKTGTRFQPGSLFRSNDIRQRISQFRRPGGKLSFTIGLIR
jgi:hypothetical protein